MFVTRLLLSILFLPVFISAQQTSAMFGLASRCGQPANDSLVELISADSGKQIQTVITPENGNYRFENIAPGRYFIRIGDRRYGPRYELFQSAPLVISAAESKEQNLTIPVECKMHEWLSLKDIPPVNISAGET